MPRNPDLQYWFWLKDWIRRRARGQCEFCRRARGVALHHRTYERFGNERFEDVMLVCHDCHECIHFGGLYDPGPDSLADMGDSGMGLTPLWLEYLEQVTDDIMRDAEDQMGWTGRD